MNFQGSKIKKISIPRIGDYSQVIGEQLAEVLKKEKINHIEFISAPLTTKKTVLRGWQLMDENMCLPAKITLGNMLDAIEEQGVDGIVMWDSCGDCRYKVYHILHQNILKRLGYKTRMYRFRGKQAIKDLQAIDKAITKKVALKMLWQGLWRIWKEDKPLLEKQAEIPQDQPKIGIVGEIYTILDPNANLRLLEKLKKQGAFLHNSLPLSEFCFKKLWHKPFWRRLGFKRPDINYRVLEQAKKEAENYFPQYTVGGHGKESVINTIYYAKMGFDGVIHVQPFPCVTGETNITTDDYRQKKIKDIKIGDKVLTHKGRFREVIRTSIRQYSGKIFNVDCGGELKLKVTPEHPVLLLRREEINHHPKFMAIRNAEKEDWLAIPKNNYERRKNVRFIETEDYFLTPIKNIKQQHYKGKVYNLGVKDDNSYIANFLAVHNCMPESTVSEFLDEISQDYHIPVNHLTFDQQFGEANLNTRVEAMVNMLKIRKDLKAVQKNHGQHFTKK